MCDRYDYSKVTTVTRQAYPGGDWVDTYVGFNVHAFPNGISYERDGNRITVSFNCDNARVEDNGNLLRILNPKYPSAAVYRENELQEMERRLKRERNASVVGGSKKKHTKKSTVKTGPNGGKYYMSASGRKVYVKA